MARIGSSTNTNCGRDGRFWEPRGSVIEGEVVPELPVPPPPPPKRVFREDAPGKKLWDRLVDWFERPG